jgi:hypothetical protein
MEKILPVLFFTLLAASGCSDPQSPEAQVKAVVAAMETAAEARDVGDLMEHVSKNYRDAYGQGPDEASRYVRGFFIANQSVHLLTRVEAIEFPATDEARASVLVGMASRAAESAASWDLAADLYEFDVVLVRDGGDWKVTYAEWKRR